MAHAIESRANSPANDLRDELEKAERRIVTLDGANVEDFLLLLDGIEQTFEKLAQNQADLRPEEARWESLLSRLSSKPGPLVAAAKQAGGLAALRAKHPPAKSFWWHLDVELATRRARSVRRALITTIVTVLVVVGGLRAVDYFFPPDPRAVAMVNTNAEIEQLIFDGEWEAALEVVMRAQQEWPDEPELVVWEAVLSEQLGDERRAQRALERAQQLVADNPVGLWVLVGNNRLNVGNLDGAEAAANQALAIAPEEPQAIFLLGSVAEARGDNATAIERFNQVFELAEADNPQLAVIARVRMGNLLQRMEPFTETTTITATDVITPN